MRHLLTRAEVLNNTSPAGTVSAEAEILCEGDPPLGQEVTLHCREKEKKDRQFERTVRRKPRSCQNVFGI